MIFDARVRAALGLVWPEAAAAGAQWRALGGGTVPRSVLVVAGEERRVLRLPSARAPGTVEFDAELRAMRAAASAGLAPPIESAHADGAILLTRYFGSPWTPEVARRPASIARMAATLCELHELRARLPRFAARPVAQRYIEAVRDRLEVHEHAWAHEYLDLASRFDAQHAATALCHNDLVAANVLDDGERLALIDFEYAVRAAPVLDLAGLAAMNGFSPERCRELLAAYADRGKPPATLVELAEAVRMVQLQAYFWARLGEIRAPRPGSHAELAKELGRALQ